MVGAVRANQLRDLTLQTYIQAADHALTKGIIIADTKFEFGVDEHGNLVLADEVFTPDSSRYWAADTYQEGVVQPSFDKQFVRNWLLSPESGWDRGGDEPPPPLPPDIVDATRERYINAYERISGLRFADWIGADRVTNPPDREAGRSTAASITATSSSTPTSGCATSPIPR